MTDSVRATGPADVLSYIPHTLGNVPRESFVFLTVQGNRLGATLRVDAPTAATPGMFAHTIGGFLEADKAATSVLLAVYTDLTAEDAPRPFHEYIEALIEVLDAAGTPLKDGWLVTSTHWQDLLCDSEAGCCAPQPLDAITDSALNAEMVFRGSAYNAGPGTTYAPYAGPAEATEWIQSMYGHLLAEDLSAPRAQWAAALEASEPLTGVKAVELVAAFQAPAVRDALLVNIIDPDLPDAEDSGALLLGSGIAPDWTRVDKAQAVARELITAAPAGYRAPLLTLIGWTDYLKGRASSAGEHFALAQADAPGYRLAELLDQMMVLRPIADTAKNPATAYKRER